MSARVTALLAAVVLVVAAVSACTVDGRFPATSACPSEPRAPGTLPDLEARLPSKLVELGSNDPARPPTTVDSGWQCLESSLRSYATHGVTRLEFAGATWDEGDGDGTVAAVFRTAEPDPPLEAAWVEEFYELTARADRRVSNVEIQRLNLAGAGAVWRFDAINDLSLQTIVVWPDGSDVRVVIVASTVAPGASREGHDRRVESAVDAVVDASLPGG